MPVQFNIYDPTKIAQLKSHLESAAAKGKAKPYVIYVDNLMAVPETQDPSEFDNYEIYLSPANSFVKVVIFCTANTNRNDQWYFSLKAKDSSEAFEEGLSGLPVKTYSQKELEELNEQRRIKALEGEEIKKLQVQFSELNGAKNDLHTLVSTKEKENERLIKALELAEANRNTIHGLNVAKLLADTGQEIIRNNTSVIAKIPALAGIAKAIEEDTKERNEQQAENGSETIGEVNFKKKSSTDSGQGLSEQQKEFLRIFAMMQGHFTNEEIKKVFVILNNLAQNKEKIQILFDLLEEKSAKQTQA